MKLNKRNALNDKTVTAFATRCTCRCGCYCTGGESDYFSNQVYDHKDDLNRSFYTSEDDM